MYIIHIYILSIYLFIDVSIYTSFGNNNLNLYTHIYISDLQIFLGLTMKQKV